MERWAIYCEGCGTLGDFTFMWRGRSERHIRRNIRRRPCPSCGCIALMVVSDAWANEERDFQERLSDVLNEPQDTPLDVWAAGIDALLEEVRRKQ
jgi:hypothetical protein